MKTDFGDLRSAVHAEQDREQRAKEVLASYDDNPQQALAYVQAHGLLDIVSMWRGTCEQTPQDENPLRTLGYKEIDSIWLDGGVLDGYINVGAEMVHVISIPDDHMIYQRWALDHVRRPTLEKYWNPWFQSRVDAGEVTEQDRRAHGLLWEMVSVHHPAFIAGELSVGKWRGFARAAYNAAYAAAAYDAAAYAAAYADAARTAYAAAYAGAYAARTAYAAAYAGAYAQYGKSLASWLIGQYGWNAWGGVQ